jgi:hypothetical protein
MKQPVRNLILCLIAVILSVCPLFGASAESEDLTEPFVIDLDLSAMSGTVVYAQVYNMLCDPDAYLGKVIRMAGYYNYYDDQAHGVVYHACIVPDATACCAQGIEFVWAGEHVWPDAYPEIGTDVVVTGRLELYEEDGIKYLHLVDAELTWNQEAQP